MHSSKSDAFLRNQTSVFIKYKNIQFNINPMINTNIELWTPEERFVYTILNKPVKTVNQIKFILT